MDFRWFFQTSFELFGSRLSVAGILGCAGVLLVGILLSTVLQGDRFRVLLSRIGLDKGFVAFVTSALSLVVTAAAILFGLQVAGFAIDWNRNVPGLQMSPASLVRLIAFLLLVFWGSSFAKRVLFNRFLSRSGMDRSLQYAIAQVAGYVVLIIGVYIVIDNAGINLSALTVFAGALGVGLGFGLQNIASNFISGLVILAERPIKIGDRVEVGELAGLVTQIRSRSTTIVTNDNISIIVPNSRFIDEPVTNWSHGEVKVRFRIPVGVAYGSDVDKVREALIVAATSHPASLKKPEPTVFFDSFGDSALNFELVVWSDEMSYRPRRFRSDLNFAIERSLREAGITIPFPQRDVHLFHHPSEPQP